MPVSFPSIVLLALELQILYLVLNALQFSLVAALQSLVVVFELLELRVLAQNVRLSALILFKWMPASLVVHLIEVGLVNHLLRAWHHPVLRKMVILV